MEAAERLGRRSINKGAGGINPPHHVADPDGIVPQSRHPGPNRGPLAGHFVEFALADNDGLRSAVVDIPYPDFTVLEQNATEIVIHQERSLTLGSGDCAVIGHCMIQSNGIQIRPQVGRTAKAGQNSLTVHIWLCGIRPGTELQIIDIGGIVQIRLLNKWQNISAP